MKKLQSKKPLFWGVTVLSLLLVACGGGASDSSSSGNAISANDAAVLVGVYQGSETVRLIRSADNAVVDSDSNEVSVSLDRTGRLSFSSSGGKSRASSNHTG